MSRWKVNIRMLPVKAHYFFFSAGSSALIPFIPVLGKQLGISSAEVGAVCGAAPLLSFLAKPAFGFIADHFKKRKSIFLFCILLSLMSSICIAFLTQEPIKRPVVFECSFGSSYIKQCNGGIRKCAGESVTSELTGEVHSYYEQYPSTSSHLHKIRIDDDDDYEDLNHTKSSTELYETKNNLSHPEHFLSHQEEEDEMCSVTCYLHSVPQFLDFCNNLDQHYMPDDCIRKEQDAASSANKLSSTELSSGSRQYKTTSNPSYKEIEPYSLNFDVKLKLSASQIVEDCLFLRVDAISFKPGVDSLQKISCLSNQNILDTCFADCPNNHALNLKLERIMPDEVEPFTSTKFWLYGLLVIIAFVCLAVVNSIADALCFQLLGDRPDMYGMQRLWGAVGWGIFTLFAGFLIDSTSKGELLKDYTPCFYLLAGLLILDLIVAYKWEIKEMPKPKALAKDVCGLLTDLRIIVFIKGCLIVGMCTGLHWNFLLWFVEDVAYENCDDTGNLKTLQGVMVAVQCLSEMPFFYYAKSFIKRLGYVNCMTLVLFVFGVRFIIYSYLTHVWLFIPVELLHGITYGTFYSVMATYASSISPPGTSATVQGIFGASFEGIGVAAGSLVGGALHQLWGGKTAFRVFGVGALIFCVIHHVLMIFFNKKRVYGVPISTTEPEGREMCTINGVSHEVDMDSE